MNKKKVGLIIGIILFVMLIVGASALYKNLSGKYDNGGIGDNVEADDESDAPNFVIFDKDGNKVTLAKFEGKPIVLNCWASWCGPCRMEMPDFNEVYNEYKDDVHFLMVNMTTSDNETLENAMTFVLQSEFDFPVYYDVNGHVASRYGIYYLPTTFFINSEGKVVNYANTMLTKDALIEEVKSLLE